MPNPDRLDDIEALTSQSICVPNSQVIYLISLARTADRLAFQVDNHEKGANDLHFTTLKEALAAYQKARHP